MGDDLNRVILIGRLVKQAELVSTQNGSNLVKFSIAVNKSKKKDNEWVKEPHYFDVIYWGNKARGIAPYLDKGQQVGIDGELRQQRWEQQDGQKRSRVEIEANNVQLMGGKKDDSSRPVATQTQTLPQGTFEDSIPF